MTTAQPEQGQLPEEPAICFHVHHCGATASAPCTATPGRRGIEARRAARRRAK